MPSKASLLVMAALYSAACVAADEGPKAQPPPLWSGDSGWLIHGRSIRVYEGTQPIGALIVEHDMVLKRTGILKQSVHLRDAAGAEMNLPEGSRAFAAELALIEDGKQIAGSNTIEWCVVPTQASGSQPETICIFWEHEHGARYDQYLRPNGFAFMPVTRGRLDMRGPVPRIEEGPVDFGVQFKHQRRVVELGERDITIETIYTDGTHIKSEQREKHDWANSDQFMMDAGDDLVELTRAADGKSVNVRRVTETVLQFDRNSVTAAKEIKVVIEALVGVDGRIKDGRIVNSTGNANTDAKILEEVKRSWRTAPIQKKGKPVEQWGRFTVIFKFED